MARNEAAGGARRYRVEPVRWFERSFDLDLPVSLYPCLIERLRGTPSRLEERLAGRPQRLLTRRPPDRSWSAQEHAGHLLDLEPLWWGRLEDFEEGRERLREADLTNRRTHEADHHGRRIAAILQELLVARGRLVRRLEEIDPSVVARTALHPRLGRPMRLVDHLFFVAEHDDHHLARVTRLLDR